MVALFAAGIVIAMYLTGGIGDGVGIFEDTGGETQAAGGAGTSGRQPAGAGGTFDDVLGRDAQETVDRAVAADAMSPCGGEGSRTFCPEQPITRAEFAVALDAVLEPPDAELQFDDVPPDAAYAAAVARIAAAGVTSGCRENEFCPDGPVTRAQAAALVSRTIDLPAEPVQSFDDVAQASVFADVIGRMAAQGIMAECSIAPPRFCPDESLTRLDAASLLDRAGLLG